MSSVDLLQGKKINVIDNYISLEESKLLYNLMISGYFNWYFMPWTLTDNEEDLEKGFYESPQYTHSFVRNSELCCPDAKTVIYLAKLNHRRIIRLKANNTLNVNKKGISNPPHIDNENLANQLVNGILFLHETDGDTVFFDSERREEFRVSPAPGRAVFMEGTVLHAGNNPIEYPHRLVLNMNLFR